jgi:hypothetical protein
MYYNLHMLDKIVSTNPLVRLLSTQRQVRFHLHVIPFLLWIGESPPRTCRLCGGACREQTDQTDYPDQLVCLASLFYINI